MKSYPWSLCFGDHHESHAASAFYPSPFEEATIVTVDGVGEWATCSVGVGRGHDMTLLHELRFPRLTGAALLRLYLFHGVQGQQRRIQDHGGWRRMASRRTSPSSRTSCSTSARMAPSG